MRWKQRAKTSRNLKIDKFAKKMSDSFVIRLDISKNMHSLIYITSEFFKLGKPLKLDCSAQNRTLKIIKN